MLPRSKAAACVASASVITPAFSSSRHSISSECIPKVYRPDPLRRSRYNAGMRSRRHSLTVKVGSVSIGGASPIVVQSMTNTDTADIDGTVAQVKALARAGSELVRVTVNNDESAAAVPHIRERLDAQGVKTPLVGDFHFNGHKLLKAHQACAQALSKLRINPGNVGRGSKRAPQFAEMIETACK